MPSSEWKRQAAKLASGDGGNIDVAIASRRPLVWQMAFCKLTLKRPSKEGTNGRAVSARENAAASLSEKFPLQKSASPAIDVESNNTTQEEPFHPVVGEQTRDSFQGQEKGL